MVHASYCFRKVMAVSADELDLAFVDVLRHQCQSEFLNQAPGPARGGYGAEAGVELGGLVSSEVVEAVPPRRCLSRTRTSIVPSPLTSHLENKASAYDSTDMQGLGFTAGMGMRWGTKAHSSVANPA